MVNNRTAFILTIVLVSLGAYFGMKLGDQASPGLADGEGVALGLIVGLILTAAGVIISIAIEHEILTKPTTEVESNNLFRIIIPVGTMFFAGLSYGILVAPFQSENLFFAFLNGWGIILVVGIFPILLRVINSVRDESKPDPRNK